MAEWRNLFELGSCRVVVTSFVGGGSNDLFDDSVPTNQSRQFDDNANETRLTLTVGPDGLVTLECQQDVFGEYFVMVFPDYPRDYPARIISPQFGESYTTAGGFIGLNSGDVYRDWPTIQPPGPLDLSDLTGERLGVGVAVYTGGA